MKHKIISNGLIELDLARSRNVQINNELFLLHARVTLPVYFGASYIESQVTIDRRIREYLVNGYDAI